MGKVENRINTQRYYRQMRVKAFKLRAVTAGDISVLDGEKSIEANSDNEFSEVYRSQVDEQDYCREILVTSIEEGRSNKLLEVTRGLALKVSMRFPDIEFEDLQPDMAALHSMYMKEIARMCDMSTHVRKATVSYIINGLGVVYCGVKGEIPFAEYVDILDLTWDLQAKDYESISWVSCKRRMSIEKWREMFPKSKVLAEYDDGEDGDVPVTVECYHDVDGVEAYYLCRGDAVSEDDLIAIRPNQYKRWSGGQLKTCVPYVFMHGLEIPNVKLPLSFVELMLPHQIALWQCERLLRDNIETGKPVREVEVGSYTEESWESFKSGRGTILERNPGKSPMTVTGMERLPEGLQEYMGSESQYLTAMGGLSPYQSATTVENTKFAAEVNAIQSAAGLIENSIVKDVGIFWAEITRRIIAIGSMFHDTEITLRLPVQGGLLPVTFDESDPIKEYLQPDIDPIISEEGVLYKTGQQKLSEWMALLPVAQAAAPMFPSMFTKLIEEILRAKGIKNIQEWLAPAEQRPELAAASTAG